MRRTNIRDEQLGMCTLHSRKRKVHDLIPLPGVPGQFRCLPHRECFVRDVNDIVTCSIHGNRRNKAQTHQVADGVYECLPQYPCHAKPGAPVPTAPEVHEEVTALPSNFRISMGQLRLPPVVIGSMLEATATEVWCSLHGKKILQSYCKWSDATYYECSDASACMLSQPEVPSVLIAKGCLSLVCSVHGRLRRTRFMKVSDNNMGYSCQDDHQCVVRRSRGDNLNEPTEAD